MQYKYSTSAALLAVGHIANALFVSHTDDIVAIASFEAGVGCRSLRARTQTSLESSASCQPGAFGCLVRHCILPVERLADLLEWKRCHRDRHTAHFGKMWPERSAALKGRGA